MQYAYKNLVYSNNKKVCLPPYLVCTYVVNDQLNWYNIFSCECEMISSSNNIRLCFGLNLLTIPVVMIWQNCDGYFLSACTNFASVGSSIHSLPLRVCHFLFITNAFLVRCSSQSKSKRYLKKESIMKYILNSVYFQDLTQRSLYSPERKSNRYLWMLRLRQNCGEKWISSEY